MIKAFFLLVLAIANPAFAETVPSIQGETQYYIQGGTPSGLFPTYNSVCQAWLPTIPKHSSNYSWELYFNDYGACSAKQLYQGSWNGNVTSATVSQTTAKTCPAGGYTIDPDKTTCSRPDCAQGELRQDDGSCKPANACEPKTGQTVNQTYAAIGEPSVGSNYCIGGCYAALKTVSPIKTSCSFNNTGQGFCYQVRDWSAAYTGSTCAGDKDAPPTGEKKVEGKKPPCGADQGVLTSTSGTVACVPEGTPDAAKPKVEKSVSAETYPDGTQKITETQTTTDPDTGAKTRTTTTTSQGGQSGAPGTQTGVEESTGGNPASGAGTCTGANCGSGGQGGVGKFPGTGDLYTKGEKTVSSVIQSFADGVKGSGLGVAVGNYFKLSGGSGGCPSWSVNVEFLKTNLDIGQYFCNPTAVGYLQLFGNVLMIVVSFVAFRWAIL